MTENMKFLLSNYGDNGNAMEERVNGKRLWFIILVTLWLLCSVAASSSQVNELGQIAFVSNRDGNREIYVMNSDGSGLTNLTNHPAADSAPVWSPDGAEIAFTSNREGDRELYLMNADGSDVRRLAPGIPYARHPVWSPDGSRIAFSSQEFLSKPLHIYHVNRDGSGLTEIYNQTTDSGGRLSWSPDGTQLLFDAHVGDPSAGGGYEIFLVEDDGSNIRTPVRTERWNFDPVWSPASNLIAFSSDRAGGQLDVWTAAPDGSDLRNLTASVNYAFGPVWSPDGRRLALMSAGEGLYVADVDSDALTRVSDLSYQGTDSEWSWAPDGSSLAFAAPVPGTSEQSARDIFVVAADGTSQVNLTDYPARDEEPAWRPEYKPQGEPLSGRITDYNTGNGLTGVTVELDSREVQTDDDGRFTFSEVPPGTYTLTPTLRTTLMNYLFLPVTRTVTVPLGDESVEFRGSGDLDQDGLYDVWEVEGYHPPGDDSVFVDLPAMGADPNHKDIFVEVDYMVDVPCFRGICITRHTHQPKADAMSLVVDAFARAPVTNPDGLPGINLHIDYGRDAPMDGDRTWGNLSWSNPLEHDDEINAEEFFSTRRASMGLGRDRIFHYAIFAHFLDTGDNRGHCVSGSSPGSPGGTNLIVSLAGWGDSDLRGGHGCRDDRLGQLATGTPKQQAGTFMHELGHNLGLRHGGDDRISGKPNYLSVMNYAFQMRGLISTRQEGPLFDYSRTDTIPDLNEQHLDETVGLNAGSSVSGYGTRWACPNRTITYTLDANGAIDWNCDGTTAGQTDVSANINNSGEWYRNAPSPAGETLTAYDDWQNLIFLRGDSRGSEQGVITTLTEPSPVELTLEQDRAIPDPYQVSVIGPGGLSAPLGYATVYTLTMANIGDEADRYTLAATSSLGWADTSSIPSSIQLGSGEVLTVSVPVAIPLSAAADDQDKLQFKVTSEADPAVWDTLLAVTTVNPDAPAVDPGQDDPVAVTSEETGDSPLTAATSPAVAESPPSAAATVEPGLWSEIGRWALLGLALLTVTLAGSVLLRRRRWQGPDSPSRFCPHCGAEYPPTGKYCIKCGNSRE